MQKIVVVISGVVAFLYLLNPTLGFLEFIPDNFPLVGNIDEVAATLLLVAALRYFGIDVGEHFSKKPKPPTNS